MQFKFINQLESNDCGPACLAMIANSYGHKVDLKETKELCSVTRMGVSVRDILEGGKKMGLDAHGLKLTSENLEEIPLPSILYWKQDHFVVLHKIKHKKDKTFYYIADPGYGKTKVEKELLEKEWIGNNVKGVCLAFEPNEEFKPYNGNKSQISKKDELLSSLLTFVKKNKFKYFLSLFLLIAGLGANWAIPLIFQRIIDDGIIAKSINVVISLLVAQLILFLSNFSGHLFSDFLLTKFNFKLSINLKENFLKKLIKLPINYFDTRLNTDTLLRISDLSKIQNFLTWKGVGFLINILNLIVFSAILFYLNTVVFFVYLVLSIISIIWVASYLKRRATLEYSMFIRQSDNSNMIYEFIMNMPEIKVNQAQGTFISKITAIQEKLNDLELKSIFLNMYQLSGANFILKLKELGIIAYCAYLIINSNMTVGTLLSISYIIGQLSGPIINLINNLKDAQDAKISNKRVQDVYNVENESTYVPDNPIEYEIGDITLDHISFKYPGSFNHEVIKDLSLTIPKNKVTAIVGTSGSGKTTLMKLLMKYYQPTHGNILLDEVNFNSLHADSWRKQCGVVLQDGHIFSGSIKYNITLLNDEDDIDEEALTRAIKIACLDEFVDNLPLGVETKIGNIGIQLSGGQNQRVLIARAVYKNPEFLFFDEATSSLDANTEKSIINNFNDFFKGKTVIVVAHRLSTVKNADQIVVIEKGQLVEVGNHEELVATKGKYHSLIKNQLELGN